MIRSRSRGRGHRLDRVEPIHAIGLLGTPARREIARVADRSRSAAENIGVERQDDVGLAETVLRVDVLAESELRAAAHMLAACRIPLMPFRGRKARKQVSDLSGERRRVDRLSEDAEPRALERALCRERRADGPEKRGPRADVAQVQQRLRAIRIVEAENRGLSEHIGRAKTPRMQRVAFDFRRTAFVALDEQAGGDASERHRGRIEEWSAGDEVFGLADIRDDRFRGLPRAAGDAGERERRTHQLHVRRATGSEIASISDGNSL